MTIHLATTLKRKTTQVLNEANSSRKPILITQFGKPSAYIVDAHSFESTALRISVLEKIARGEKAIKEKRTTTHRAARRIFDRWLE